MFYTFISVYVITDPFFSVTIRTVVNVILGLFQKLIVMDMGGNQINLLWVVSCIILQNL